jgi:hypothetical protein
MGGPKRHTKPLGRSDQAGQPKPFLGQFGPVFLPMAHLHILHLAPFTCVILRSSSRDQDKGSCRMKSELYVLVLGEDPS